MTNPSQKNPKPPGGQVGMRGYLVQTLIALLDVVLAVPPFKSLTLEPGHESEQFDLVWEDAQGCHAMQVKSTEGQFAKAAVKGWAEELEKSGKADEYRLRLVGLYPPSLAKEKRLGRVLLQKKNLDLMAFHAEAAHMLDLFLRAEGLESGSANDREMLADALTARLATYSTNGKSLVRSELVSLLKFWVAEKLGLAVHKLPNQLFSGSWHLYAVRHRNGRHAWVHMTLRLSRGSSTDLCVGRMSVVSPEGIRLKYCFEVMLRDERLIMFFKPAQTSESVALLVFPTFGYGLGSMHYGLGFVQTYDLDQTLTPAVFTQRCIGQLHREGELPPKFVAQLNQQWKSWFSSKQSAVIDGVLRNAPEKFSNVP